MSESARQPSRLRNFCSCCRLFLAIAKSVLILPFQRKIELRDPQSLLAQQLGDDVQVLDFVTDKLCSFGDNYNSTIVKLVVNVKIQPNDSSERLDLVAKMLPPSKFARKELRAHDILAKEIFFYEQIIPTYDQLGTGSLDITPRFYGGRLTSKPTEVGFDESAVLLLENLKEKGYAMADRSVGLTWDHLKLALPAIAKFHARGLAIKQKLPECYSKLRNQAEFVFPPQMLNVLMSRLMKLLKNNSQLSNYYERVKSLRKLDADGNYSIFERLDFESPYACLAHRDLWINNVMFHSSDGKLDAFKIFDFQLFNISSPMTDLLYFLFTSLPRSFVGFDDAVELYRQCICDALAELQCDASFFGMQAFEARLKEDARIELYRCLLMANNVELKSAWDFIRTSDDVIRRFKGILGVYDARGWFDD